MNHPVLTRRGLLRYSVGLAGLAVVTAACSQPAASPTAAPTTAAAAPAATSAAPAATAATSSAAATATPAPAAASNAGAATAGAIQVATRTGTDAQIMTKTAQDYSTKNGVKVTAVAYGTQDQYASKVQALFATKQLADVVWASTGFLASFAARGLVAPLDEIIKADNYDMSDYVQNALVSCSLKGKLYGMPWGCHPGNGGLVYNADMLQSVGFTKVTDDPTTILDWTYDTLMQAAVKLTKRSGDQVSVYGYLPLTDSLSLQNVTGAYGADFMTPDGTKLTMDTPQFLQALNWVRDAYVTNKVSPASNSNGDQLFDSQKLAMELSGYWGQFQPGIKDNAFKWNDSLQPLGPANKRGTHLTINGQTISGISQNQKDAWGFIKYLMDPAQNIQIVLAGGSRPAARKAVLESPALEQQMKAHKVWVQDIETAAPWLQPANFRWSEFDTTVTQAFGDVWVGKQTVEEALPNATKLLQAVLDKPAAG